MITLKGELTSFACGEGEKGVVMEKVEVFLVPGFMGFDTIARLHYFEDVVPLLERRLAALGYEAKVFATSTVPAGALEKRARFLMKQLLEKHDRACESVHLLGHSTGGLDIRLLLSPGSSFDVGGEIEASFLAELTTSEQKEKLRTQYAHVLGSVRSAMGLAAPHYGTPTADLLLKIGFDIVLKDLSRLDEATRMRRVVATLIKLAGTGASLLDAVRLSPSFLRWINEAVLSRSPDGVLDYLGSLGEDLGALRNLTQESATLFNAAVRKRPHVDYASFCTGNDRPHGPLEGEDPLVRFFTLIYRRLWPVVAERNPAYGYAPREVLAEARALYVRDVAEGRSVGTLHLDDATNDGMVPTESQMFGRVAAVFASDHLDCIGMYPHGVTSGWVRSGAGFDDARFQLVWGRVADVIHAAHTTARPRFGSTTALRGTTSSEPALASSKTPIESA